APEVSEFSVTVQIDRTPNNVIMHMGFVNVSADNKGVVASGKPFGKFLAQPGGFFRRDFTRTERLTEMVSNHMVLPPLPSCDGNILTLGHNKLCVCNRASRRISGNEPAVVCLLGISHRVDNITDCSASCAALASGLRDKTGTFPAPHFS